MLAAEKPAHGDLRNGSALPAFAAERRVENRSPTMAKKSVLAIGIDPVLVDFTALPQFTPEMFRSYIDAQLERVRGMGYDVRSCLIDLGDTAEAVTAEALRSRDFDCVLIGAGLRQPPERLLLFERIINLIHRLAPRASICFNTTPADTAEAVRRWVPA
jgi:hypothetical protein